MDDIQTRLQQTSKNCLEAYEAWEKNKTNGKAQEGLHVAIHELRKVCSRLEIELAISERDQVVSRPLPIPAHRSANKEATSIPILEQPLSSTENNTQVVQKSSSSTRRRRTSSRKQSE